MEVKIQSNLCSRPDQVEQVKEKPTLEKVPIKHRPNLERTFLDRDAEFLFQKNEPDIDLDEQFREELRKKKSDSRYIEMQVLYNAKVTWFE